VAAALAKSLEKLPADRFESAKAFAEALGNPAFTTPTLSGTGGTRGPHGVSPGAFRATAAVAAVALIAAAAGWLRPAPRPELSRFAITLPDSQAMQGYAIGIGNLRLAISPDGRTIVYAGVGATPGSRRLWMRPLDALTATPLPGTEDGYNPAFSPDGQRVAFIVGSPRALKSIALAGGPAVTLTDSLVDAGGVSWGHDGYIYTDGRLAGDGLMRVRETGGSPEVASMPDTAAQEAWHAAPSALPNGRGVLFSIAHLRGQGEWQIGVLDTRTGRHKALVSGVQGRYAASGHLLYVTSDGTLMAAPFDQDKL
jgi:serine/threonine-protein kinase